MATKIIITFDTIQDAGEYIVEKLVAQGKKFTYRAVGIMGTPEVELEPTNAEMDNLLRKPAPEPDDYLCRTCDHYLQRVGEAVCLLHGVKGMRAGNTCPEHTYQGTQCGTSQGVESFNPCCNEVYKVRVFPDGTAACNCPAFKFKWHERPCKHILAVR